MKVLNLILKKIWYDMIFKLDKKEEYREITQYWCSRLLLFEGKKKSQKFWKNIIIESDQKKTVGLLLKYLYDDKITFIKFDYISFSNGYGKKRPHFTIEVKDINISIGNPLWGAEMFKYYFVFSLGNNIGFAINNKPKNIIDIVYNYLKENKFDGLYCEELSCGCNLDDLIPCDFSFQSCKHGYQYKDGCDMCSIKSNCNNYGAIEKGDFCIRNFK